jgi:hypothetical protein
VQVLEALEEAALVRLALFRLVYPAYSHPYVRTVYNTQRFQGAFQVEKLIIGQLDT